MFARRTLAGAFEALAAISLTLPVGSQENRSVDLSQPASLKQCLDIAAVNHPRLKETQADVESARWKVVESKSSLYPSVGLVSNWSRFNSSRQGFSVGSAGASENRETAVGVAYEFLDSGQRANAIRLSTTTAQATEAGLTVARQAIALAVAQAYFELLASQDIVALRDQVVASADAHVASARAGFEAGTKARIDILRAETELANARVDVITARGDVRRAQAALRNSMGLTQEIELQVLQEGPQVSPVSSLEAARQAAQQRREELRQQELNVKASGLSVKSSEIDAGVAYSLAGSYDQYLDSSRDTTDEYVLRAALSYPIFDGKSSRSRVKAARADLKAVQQQLEQQRQAILLEVDQAWITVDDARARVEAAEAAKKQSVENLALNEFSYREGVASMVEVIDARSAAAQADSNAIRARYDYDLAVCSLRYAMGQTVIEEDRR